MKCKTCGNEKTALLTSVVCDHCDPPRGRKEESWLDDTYWSRLANTLTARVIVEQKPPLFIDCSVVTPTYWRRESMTEIARKLFPVEPLPPPTKMLFIRGDRWRHVRRGRRR